MICASARQVCGKKVSLLREAGSGGCGGCGDSRFPVWLPMIARCVPGAINNWSVPGSAAGSVCETMLDAWVGRVGWMGLSVESVLSSLLRLFLSFFFLSFLLHMRRSYVFICLSTGTVAMRSRPRGVCRVDVRAMVLCFCTRASSFFSLFLFPLLSRSSCRQTAMVMPHMFFLFPQHLQVRFLSLISPSSSWLAAVAMMKMTRQRQQVRRL